jgi:rubrerythrin
VPDTLTVTEVLRTGIQREIESQKLYTELGRMVVDQQAKYVFAKLVREEKRHQEILERFVAGGIREGMLKPDEVLDYRIAEHLEQPPVKPDMTLAEIFLLAANREKMSNEFYLGLAGAYPSGEAKKLLLKLASQELGHKQQMEKLYADVAFPQTDGG